jgi:DNA-directed RNA polymerase specialized sigma24 family protein
MTGHLSTKHIIQSLTRSELLAAVEDAMLSPKERDIIIMIYLRHWKINYIAYKIGYAESTVRLKHRQAVAKIKNVLKKDGQG